MAWRPSTALLLCCLSPAARAGTWTFLAAGQPYEISWRATPEAHAVYASVRVDRSGWFPTDRWFQTAPGGNAAAIWSRSSGLSVLSADGAELLRRPDEISAFRFSSSGDRLAFASARGIEVLSLQSRQTSVLVSTRGVKVLWWTDHGLIAQAVDGILLLDFAGHVRTLATVPSTSIVLAAKDRMLYFTRGLLSIVNLAHGVTTTITLPLREPVVRAELSADSSKLLFATTRNVYRSDGEAEPRAIALAHATRDLCISPDGQSYLWASGSPGDTLVQGGEKFALPPGTRSARFDPHGNVFVTMLSGNYLWDARTGARTLVGGISEDDGLNMAGDVLNKQAVIALYIKKSVAFKEQQMPSALQDP